METDKEHDAAAFGERIGKRLAAKKASVANPMVAIRAFVAMVLEHYPAVKLPELAGDAEVKTWLERRALGEGHLRQVLTEARKTLRGKAIESPVKRPPRRSKAKVESIAEPAPRTAAKLAAQAVPNRPLSEL